MTLDLALSVDFSSMDAFLLSASDHIVEDLGAALTACALLVTKSAAETTKFRDGDGTLRRSLGEGSSIHRSEPYYDVQGGLGIDLLAGAGTVHYGTYLEFGTKTIEPRRFMRDAVARHEQDIGTILTAAVGKAFADAGAPTS
jgi:HK97 gp10 family phage protein